MNKIAKYLNQHLIGNVFERDEIAEKYSFDRSIVKVEPKMVVIPENTNDVRRTVRFVNQLAIKDVYLSTAVRGSGLDKTGADLGKDIVVSMEHMNHIQEIDERSRLVRVQAGTTLGDLNQALSLFGLTVPIDADPRETIGSLISNFTTDNYAGKYNGIYYYVDCMEVVTSTGDVIQTSRYSKRGIKAKQGLTSFEGAIYRNLYGLIEDNFDVISDLQRRQTIDNAGYQMVTQVYREKGHSMDLAPIFFAAQGTLGIITEVILRCEILPPEPDYLVAMFNSTEDAVKYAALVKELDPREINLYDARIFAAATESGKDTGLFSEKFSKNGYMLLISFDDRPHKSHRKVAKCLKLLPSSAAAVVETDENTLDFKKIQTALSSFLNDDLRGERAPVLDDFYVPSNRLAEFLAAVKSSEETYDMKLPLFGSIATGIYSIRPDLRLNSVEGRQTAVRLIKDFGAVIKEYDGSLTGGSPEGRIKSIVSNFAETEAEIYASIREIFDPHGIFNPKVKTHATLRDTVKTLRTGYLKDITS